MLWDQRFEASMMLRLLLRHGVSTLNPRGKVIRSIARNRYKQKARRKGVAAGAAGTFAIDAVMQVIGEMENRVRHVPEPRSSSQADHDAAVEPSHTAEAA